MTDGCRVLNEQQTPELDREQFYERDCMVAEEHDRKLTESYHEEMNRAFIPAGLFSITTLIFMRGINSQLRPDPNERAITLVCDIASGMGSTVCDNFHVAPQRSDPPPAIIQAQAMLYASFTVFMFSAFIAMLGKQWLHHYTSAIDIQGSPTERGQNRRWKFDRLATRHFHRVVQLPLFMIQVGMWLFLCALTRDPSNSNATHTWITFGVASFTVVLSLPAIVLKRPS